MRTSLLLLLLLPFNAFAQPAAPTDLPIHADSFVAYFVGEKISRQYVTPDSKHTVASKETTFFQYTFRHPKFSAEPFIIAFTLDSTGRFIPGKETRGIIKIDSTNDTQWTDAREAISICRNHGAIKKKTLRLVWDSTTVSYDDYQKTGNLNDIYPGQLVWQIDGKVNFRGEKYSGTFEVDVFTGRVFRRFAIPWD